MANEKKLSHTHTRITHPDNRRKTQIHVGGTFAVSNAVLHIKLKGARIQSTKIQLYDQSERANATCMCVGVLARENSREN